MSEDKKVVQFRSKQKKPAQENINNSLLLSGIIGNINEKWGLENDPMQQALRIELELNSIEDCKPSTQLISDQIAIISNWSAGEILSEAKKCTVEDLKIKPAFYKALVMALRASK